MQTNQDRVVAHIEKLIHDCGFVPVVTMGFANGGVIGVQAEDFPVNIGEVGFGFQPGTMKFDLTFHDGVAMREIPSQPGRADYFDFYMKHSDIAAYVIFINALTAQLTKLKTVKSKLKILAS